MVAALLVAIYHIWMMRVSGGVDVFFVVSGFLITTSLVSKYARDGYIRFTTFVLGLLKRLLPNALLVLLFVTVAGYFILPEVRHFDTMKEIVAALFYYENWQLAFIGTDYLEQTNEKSPVQHFWAMSIQGQFYVIWFGVISLVILLHRKLKRNFNKLFLLVLIALFAGSFAFSIYLTNVDQPWAYFDTRTRVWEFAVGGLLMLAIFKIRLPGLVSGIVGWTGLMALISTGLLLDVEGSFPGYVALWPVMAAVLVMVAGQNPSRFGVEKFLGSKPMVALGGLSYGLYLWHWPLLSFYYVLAGTKEVGVVHGIMIILLSLGLSYLSTTFVERPINRRITGGNFTLRAFRPILAMAGALLVAVAAWYSISQYQSISTANLAEDPDYPGVMVNAEEFDKESFTEKDPIPAMSEVKEDKEISFTNGCQQTSEEAEVELCEYGVTENLDHIVAVVGGSKSTHWTSPVKKFAEEENIKVLNVTKSGCRFSLDEVEAEDCNEWNENVADALADADVDLVVTLADIGWPKETEVPEGFIEQFERLKERDIEVLAIRDTPYFGEDIPECISAKGADHPDCAVNTDYVYPSPSPWEKLENPPENVHYVDYHEYYCDEDKCRPVVGNIIGYYDHDHMTQTFAESFTPLLRKDIMKVLESE